MPKGKILLFQMPKLNNKKRVFAENSWCGDCRTDDRGATEKYSAGSLQQGNPVGCVCKRYRGKLL